MTGLALVADAFQSLKRSPALVAGYALVCCSSEYLVQLLLPLLPESTPDLEGPAWVRMAALAALVVHAVILSAAQAVFFARLGKSIDNPLWKCEDDREALRRFFSIWLVLNMLVLLIIRLMTITREQEFESASLMLELSLMFGFALFFPAGASIMYAKVERWQDTPAALRTISSQFGLSLMVMCIGFLSFSYMLLMQELLGSEAGTIVPIVVISAPVTILDCLSFAAMWRVCMIHRDSPPEEDLSFY